ncbi:MAG TPA: PilZ domain-containing protein [Terracidiphilus sp.]|nr:PilZ domain-containing protein [Terracidiphilus sp.]
MDERFDLERAPGTLMHKGINIPCEMLDISLSGCRLRTLRPFTAGALESVKVVLSIQEMVLSIWGITQWTTWDRLVGIRFIHPTGRTRNQLAGLLTCLLDKSAAEVVKRAVAEASAEADSPIIALEHPLPVEPEPEREEEFQQPPPPPPKSKRPELRSEYKVLSLGEGDSPAVLHLVEEGTILRGSVLDVSQDGCLVRLARAIAVRLHAQAEVDFHLRGLPFRLPGITTAMHDSRMAEIRFTEMSRRKRDDLSQLIMELDAQNQAATAQSG